MPHVHAHTPLRPRPAPPPRPTPMTSMPPPRTLGGPPPLWPCIRRPAGPPRRKTPTPNSLPTRYLPTDLNCTSCLLNTSASTTDLNSTSGLNYPNYHGSASDPPFKNPWRPSRPFPSLPKPAPFPSNPANLSQSPLCPAPATPYSLLRTSTIRHFFIVLSSVVNLSTVCTRISGILRQPGSTQP